MEKRGKIHVTDTQKIHMTGTQGLVQRRKRKTTKGRGGWRRALEQGSKQDMHAYIPIYTHTKKTYSNLSVIFFKYLSSIQNTRRI